MIPEFAIFVGVPLATTALMLDEKNINIFAPASKYFDSRITDMKKSLKKNIYYLAAEEARRSYKTKLEEIRVREMLVSYQTAISNEFRINKLSGAGCYGWSALIIYCSPEQLHDVRRVLRKVFNGWTDKIDHTYCGDDSEVLCVKYKCQNIGLPFSAQIDVEYPLDSLPIGLLKPGCKVIRETRVVNSCRVECAV